MYYLYFFLIVFCHYDDDDDYADADAAEAVGIDHFRNESARRAPVALKSFFLFIVLFSRFKPKERSRKKNKKEGRKKRKKEKRIDN